jgi:ElaB/YqjD/DUF883 family membrane-anchored ribosome-binding protein
VKTRVDPFRSDATAGTFASARRSPVFCRAIFPAIRTEERNMQENTIGGSTNGEQLGAGARARTEEVKDHLRAAKNAASDAVRGTTDQARTWTRSQFSDLQERVEAEPYRAAGWALGIGFIAGVLITALASSGRR